MLASSNAANPRVPVAPVVNSIRLAWDVESVDPLRDVVSLQNDFWGCRRSVSTAGSTGSRDLGVATADRRPATGQTWLGAIFGSRQNGPSSLRKNLARAKGW